MCSTNSSFQGAYTFIVWKKQVNVINCLFLLQKSKKEAGQRPASLEETFADRIC